MDLFKKAFRGKQSKLVEEIVVGSGLWTELKDRNVLTPRQIRDCQNFSVCHYYNAILETL